MATDSFGFLWKLSEIVLHRSNTVQAIYDKIIQWMKSAVSEGDPSYMHQFRMFSIDLVSLEITYLIDYH